MKIIKKIFLVILLPLVIVSLFSCDVYNLKKDNSKNKELAYETTYDKSNASINGFVSVNKKNEYSIRTCNWRKYCRL